MLIPTSQNIKTITDMRENALKLLEEVNDCGLVYVFHHSDPKAVMLSLAEFTRLQELVEDHLDEMEAVKLKQEPKGKGIQLVSIIKKHIKKGV